MRVSSSVVIYLSAAVALILITCGARTEASTAVSPPSPSRPPGSSAAYRISSGDVLSVVVWGEEQFTRECQVNAAGTISYPLLGDVQAAGLTCGELQSHLQATLQEYLKRPCVIVTVRQYGGLGMSVSVLGEVKTPGVYPLASGGGLMQPLAAAGGPTALASGEVTIVSARTGEMRTVGLEEASLGGPASPETMIEQGDMIMVKRRTGAQQDRRYVVLGEVPTPGMFEMPLDTEVRVLDALQKAGLFGANPASRPSAGGTADDDARVADLEHSSLARRGVVAPLDLAALLQGDTSYNLVLQPGDILTVPRRALIKVHAVGEVHSPGRQTLPAGAKVLDLLNAAGGARASARLSRAVILRNAGGEPTAIPVDVGQLMSHADPEQNLALQEGDVLSIPARDEAARGVWRWLPLLPYLAGL